MSKFIRFHTGAPRTGTLGMARLVRKFGAVKVSHQPVPTFIEHQSEFVPYSLDVSPPKRVMRISHKRQGDVTVTPVISGWTESYAMLYLSNRLPDAKFTIVVRDIIGQSNSMAQLRKMSGSHEAIDYYAERWIVMYRFMLEQVKRMEEPPYLLFFDKYVAGDYVPFLIDHFRLDDDTHGIKMFLKKKINSFGEYPLLPICQSFVQESEEITERLIEFCKPVMLALDDR